MQEDPDVTTTDDVIERAQREFIKENARKLAKKFSGKQPAVLHPEDAIIFDTREILNYPKEK